MKDATHVLSIAKGNEKETQKMEKDLIHFSSLFLKSCRKNPSMQQTSEVYSFLFNSVFIHLNCGIFFKATLED